MTDMDSTVVTMLARVQLEMTQQRHQQLCCELCQRLLRTLHSSLRFQRGLLEATKSPRLRYSEIVTSTSHA